MTTAYHHDCGLETIWALYSVTNTISEKLYIVYVMFRVYLA
jgi:hypothetical protein